MAENLPPSPGPEPEQVPSAADREALAHRFIEFLNEKVPHLTPCPVCSVEAWTVGAIGEVRLFYGGNLVVGGEVYPIIPLACGNCGYIRWFNAVIAGFLPPVEKE